MQAFPFGRITPGKSGTPPCKSGQLEKDLGLEVSSAKQAARLIIFDVIKVLFVGSSAPITHLLDLRCTGTNARNASARSPSVLVHYFTLTSIAFDLAIGVVGRCTFSTPSWNSAVTFVLSASSGRVKLRRKVPKDRSMRWNFFLRSSFSVLRSPETLRMPSSTVTLTSSFFISGRSALSRYPRSSSLISTSGDQSGTVRPSISPLPILFGKQPKKNALKRFCVACSISLSGFHVITLFNVFILFTFLDSVKAILVRSPLIVRVDPNLVYV